MSVDTDFCYGRTEGELNTQNELLTNKRKKLIQIKWSVTLPVESETKNIRDNGIMENIHGKNKSVIVFSSKSCVLTYSNNLIWVFPKRFFLFLFYCHFSVDAKRPFTTCWLHARAHRGIPKHVSLWKSIRSGGTSGWRNGTKKTLFCFLYLHTNKAFCRWLVRGRGKLNCEESKGFSLHKQQQ